MQEDTELRFLVGPTAAGKSDFALDLAERAGLAVCSLDSMLVYRGMDVGTAKPTPEERERVPHYCIDRVDPPERYDAQRYLADVEEATRDATESGRGLVFVGGTGFYLKLLTHGLFEGPPVDLDLRARLEARADAEGLAVLFEELERVDAPSARRIHPNDRKRVLRALEVHRQTGRPLSEHQETWGFRGKERVRPHRILGIHRDLGELERRIRERTRRMLERGWIEEAVSIREGIGFGPTSIQALGYREVLACADGELTREACEERIALRTRQFARRQRTWFRSFEIRWIDPESAGALERALAFFE